MPVEDRRVVDRLGAEAYVFGVVARKIRGSLGRLRARVQAWEVSTRPSEVNSVAW